MLTPGSDIGIKSVFDTVLKKGKNVVTSEPCFPMYNVYAAISNANIKYVKYDSSLTLPTDNILKAVDDDTRLVVLANPNSPIGDWKSPGAIEKIAKFLQEEGIILLIDEAYSDFAPGSSDFLVKKYNNIIISRTFSKSMGAAGLRIGYLLGDSSLIKTISNLKLTFELTSVSTKFAIKLMENVNIFKEYAAEVVTQRNELFKMFSESGRYDVINSHCNWIHFNDSNDNAKADKIFSSFGIAYKNKAKIPGDSRNNWIRLAVGANMTTMPFIKKLF